MLGLLGVSPAQSALFGSPRDSILRVSRAVVQETLDGGGFLFEVAPQCRGHTSLGGEPPITRTNLAGQHN